jgi:hypothetical protein
MAFLNFIQISYQVIYLSFMHQNIFPENDFFLLYLNLIVLHHIKDEGQIPYLVI